MKISQASPRFPTNRWTLVVDAGKELAEGLEALAELCQAYRDPIDAFIRRKGNDPDHALDLAQSYFARLIERGAIAAVDPAEGRFRAFLRAATSSPIRPTATEP
jgi:DNA-directed RNA polymerase specialized sigma24 family protein